MDLRKISIAALAIGVVALIGFGQQNEVPEGCDSLVGITDSIQEAIETSVEGAIICLSGGTWQENLSIEKPVSIRAVENSQVILTGNEVGAAVVSISSEVDEEEGAPIQVELLGITITGADGQCEEPVNLVCPGGVLAEGNPDVLIENSSISLNLTRSVGLWIRDAASLTLTNVDISGNGATGILASNAATLTMANSSVTKNGEYARDLGTLFHGIQLEGETAANIAGSVISENFDVGIFVIQNAALSIANSTLSENFQGIEQGTLGPVSIHNTVLSSNGSNGLLIGFFGPVSLTDSSIVGNGNWGVTAVLEPCGFAETGDEFNGTVSGGNNTIPGAGDDEDTNNGVGAICPDVLEFLVTPEGGSYP